MRALFERKDISICSHAALLRLEFETAEVEPWEDPDPEGKLGALFEACEAGDEAAVARLAPACRTYLENGTWGPEGDTCLHLACLYMHARVVELLLSAGANVNTPDENGSTALHDASASGSLEIVQRLLELGGQELLGRADGDGETALHCAARGGHTSIVAVLLRAGADVGVVNTFGQTALMLVDPADVDTARLLDAQA
jgi:hypothetical protein